MEHHFNVELATAFGIEKAVIINNLYFWIDHNAKNKTHIHDGNVWTYNSSSAFAKLFPYIKERTLARYLIELEDKNILISGNYNINAFDKTKWYAFSIPFTYELQNWGYDIEDILSCQNTQIDTQKMANRVADSGEPIPYNKHTDSKQKEEIDKSISKKDTINYAEILLQWKKTNPNLKQPRMIDEKRKKAIRTLLKNNNATIEDLYKAFQMISISSFCNANHEKNRKWEATFDWIIKDTNGCFNRLLEGQFALTDTEKTLAEKITNGEWDESFSSKIISSPYHPYGNTSIMYDEINHCYMYIAYSYSMIADGYTDDERPDGAVLVLNSGRGTLTWSKAERKWIHKK